MEYLCDDLLEHFCSKMCPSIVALQVDNQKTKAVASSMMQQPFTCKAPVVSLDEFGQELLDCCEGHHIYDVSLSVICLQIIVSLRYSVPQTIFPKMKLYYEEPYVSRPFPFDIHTWK